MGPPGMMGPPGTLTDQNDQPAESETKCSTTFFVHSVCYILSSSLGLPGQPGKPGFKGDKGDRTDGTVSALTFALN